MDLPSNYENYDEFVVHLNHNAYVDETVPFYDHMFSVFPRTVYDVTDTMFKNGVDMQGIIWSQQRISRETYRNQRLKDYDSYLSLKKDKGDLTVEDSIKNQKVKTVSHNQQYYEFKFAKLKEACRIGHFQLRNLLWATSKNTVYYIRGNTVRQWSPQRKESKEILDLDNTQTNYFRTMKISSMACKDDILFVGGFLGDYLLQRIGPDTTTSSHYGLISNQNTGIVNHADIIMGKNGNWKILVSDNDTKARLLDVNSYAVEKTYTFAFPVNCSAMSPDKRVLCAVGDSTETHLVDAASGKNIKVMNDHHDFSFACCYSPDGMTLATGNQDKTTRIYDVRNLSRSLHVLGANVGAIRSLHFSSDGKYLAMAEPVDFVHIFDTHTYENSQVIDFFGDIAGVAFTPDDQALMIANNDDNVGGIFEFQRSQREIPLFIV
ncbi:WD40-repeat-containing domain protein [Halteromyces radiatus]|uniref:WD40-repeat-containing domain protein n=1 Tax=Halteromyces radiatus TaxID=101107 RepID=UPI00221FA186|nr:WD40-repeat-containing domain protein [Halteromyces radiatus]KAI8089835.1 WD40-repeat-containing domain protein [Halteromyces radiatus]